MLNVAVIIYIVVGGRNMITQATLRL
jgi:hypothetical protein